jgi:hypothetical protein
MKKAKVWWVNQLPFRHEKTYNNHIKDGLDDDIP